MSTIQKAQYFCSGCGAMRQLGAKRCVSCGRVFDDESNATETVYALTHPQVKQAYKTVGTVARFFDQIFGFHMVMLLIGIVMVVVGAVALSPYVIGIKAPAVVTHLEAINCRKDCQYIVDYQFTDLRGVSRTGQYHWSYNDYYFYPPEEGQPTTIKYVSFFPKLAIGVDQWFPWGYFILMGMGAAIVVAVKKNWI
ncbi:MAG: hypothetical protein ACYC6L_15400 [Anaerolineae bacterium]